MYVSITTVDCNHTKYYLKEYKMKRTKKGILCAVLCMAMILGTSLTSLAYGGSYKCGNHNIAYMTSKTNLYIVVSQCSDAYYKLEGTASVLNKAGNSVKAWPYQGGNGIDKNPVCEIRNQKPPTGYTFTNTLGNKNNIMRLYRSTNPVKNYKLLYTFKYKF